jgi:hypothetical protein
MQPLAGARQRQCWTVSHSSIAAAIISITTAAATASGIAMSRMANHRNVERRTQAPIHLNRFTFTRFTGCKA